MSCAAILWSLDQPVDNVHFRMVLIALADFHNDKEGKAWPSYAALAERAKTNRSTVMRALAQFEADGLIIDAREAREDAADHGSGSCRSESRCRSIWVTRSPSRRRLERVSPEVPLKSVVQYTGA